MGEWGNWGIGELGNWGIGELGNWGIGELGNWGAGLRLRSVLIERLTIIGINHITRRRGYTISG